VTARAPKLLLIACGALAREIAALRRLGGWDHVELDCLPAKLHVTPEAIPEAVRAKLESARGRYDQVCVAYADCGTVGRLSPRSRRPSPAPSTSPTSWLVTSTGS
jgi:hypothetical protein